MADGRTGLDLDPPIILSDKGKPLRLRVLLASFSHTPSIGAFVRSLCGRGQSLDLFSLCVPLFLEQRLPMLGRR